MFAVAVEAVTAGVDDDGDDAMAVVFIWLFCDGDELQPCCSLIERDAKDVKGRGSLLSGQDTMNDAARDKTAVALRGVPNALAAGTTPITAR